MHFPARRQFAAAALATGLGIVLVVGLGWSALDSVSDEVDAMRQQVRRLSRIEHIEGELHEFAARSGSADLRVLDRNLDALLRVPGPPGEGPLLAELQRRVADAKLADTPERWSQAAEALSEIGKLAVAEAARIAEQTSGPAKSGMRDIVRLGAAVVVMGAVLSAFALVRLRRERREAESRLRRSDRLAVLGMMAASVAHELNNPLATISGCASAVRDRLRRGGAAARAAPGAAETPAAGPSAAAPHADELEYLDMIVDETRRCSGIARSLRDLARDTPPAMTPSDLAALSRDVVSLVEMTREGPKVELERAGEESLEVVCDPDKIKQLLLNLVVNARDACADGGHVRIRIERRGDDTALITVEDDGRGIAREDIARVFEPFHTGKTRGLGLGLFICDRIATLHGGAIAVSSEGPGRGARFSVTLPLQPPPRAPVADAAAAG